MNLFEAHGGAPNDDAHSNVYHKLEKIFDNAGIQDYKHVRQQGSVSHRTNIDNSSDMDLRIQQSSFFENLPNSKRVEFFGDYAGKGRSLQEFKQDVIAVLNKNNINWKPGKYTLKIQSDGIDVDLLVCSTYRHYDPNPLEQKFDEGIKFFDADGKPVVNYPSLNKKHASLQNDATTTNFKKAVRNFKILNRDNGLHLPSFCIECLVYHTGGIFIRGDADLLMRTVINEIYNLDDAVHNIREMNNILPLLDSSKNFDDIAIYLWALRMKELVEQTSFRRTVL